MLHVLSSLLGVKPDVYYVGSPAVPITWGLLGWLGDPTPSPRWRALVAPSPPPLLPAGAQGGAGHAQLPPAWRPLETPTARWHPQRLVGALGSAGLQADLVLCVSPELAPDVCR